MYAKQITSYWLDGNMAPLMQTIRRICVSRQVTRRAVHRVVRNWRSLSKYDRTRMADCFCALAPQFWIAGDRTLEKLLVQQFHRDFPEIKIQRIQKWASQPEPKPRGRDVIEVAWMRNLIRLAYYTEGADGKRLVKWADDTFSTCNYSLLRLPNFGANESQV